MSTFIEPDWPHDPDRLGSVTLGLEQTDRARLDDVKKTYKDVLSALEAISQTFGGFAERSERLLGNQGRPGLILPWTKQGYTAESEASTGVVPGVPSPGASIPGGRPPGPPTTSGGGGTPPGDPGDNASIAPDGPPIGRMKQLWNNAQGMSFAGPHLTSMERAQIRLGQFPSYGLSQALFTASWMAGTAGWNRLPEEEVRGLDKKALEEWGATNKVDVTNARQDEAGNWFAPSDGMGAVARQSSVALGALGQISMRGLPLINRARNFALGASITGSQAGFSTSGWLGTPFMSPAFKHDIGMRIHAGEASWFGLNPNYPSAQSAEAQAVINASGYHGDDASLLAHMMQSMWQNNHFMSPEQTMQLMDPLMRYGGEDPKRLKNELDSLADAAKSAHIGLQQLSQDLTQTALGVTQQTGMSVGASTGALQAMAVATRATPSALAPMFTSQNLLMGAAITGQHYSDVMNEKGTAAAALALPMRYARMMMGGMSIQQYQDLQKTNPQMAKTILDRMYIAYAQNPQIFGGMNPRQILYIMAGQHAGTPTPKQINLRADRAAILYGTPQVNVADRAQAIMDIQGSHAMSVAGFTHEIREFGGPASKQIYKDFMKELHKTGGKVTGSNVDDLRKLILRDMDKFAGKNNDQAKQTITVILDPWARQLLKLKNGKPSETNKNESFWHKALHTTEDIVHIVEKGNDIANKVSLGLIP